VSGRTGWLKFSFWSLNIGLMAMCVLEPAAGRPDADLGLGGARLLVRPQQRVHANPVDVLRWMRVPGDTVFAIGSITLAWFVLRNTMGPGRRVKAVQGHPEPVDFPEAGPEPLGARRSGEAVG
jgi:nitric oxide reductase subunit B